MDMSTPTRRRLARAAAVSGLVLALAIPPATLAGNGNNGTVKINDSSGDGSPISQNDPKVGCTFELVFLFADGGQSGDWEIRSVSDGALADGGTYLADADGKAVVPASVLSAGHYKLFWDGDTGKHDKHKVFKSDCEGNGGGETVDQ